MNEIKRDLIGGAIVYFELSGESVHSIIEAGLNHIDLGRFTPATYTDLNALKASLQKVYGKTHRIDSLGGREGYTATVVESDEKNGVKTLNYDVGFTVHPPTTTYFPFWNPDTGDEVEPDGADEVRQGFYGNIQKVPRNNVARALTLIAAHLRGVSLKSHGGVYWIPEKSVAKWEQVCIVIETASKANRVHKIRTVIDKDSCRAYTEALREHVKYEAGVIKEKVLKGGLKKRALATKENEADELKGLIKEYESMFQVTLDDLTAIADDAGTSAAFAALQML
tara:strand:+ start:821 stop:1663 length:843 start_codon:yes stop_codon:yes gene_type:complete